jgi:hypothetical protein
MNRLFADLKLIFGALRPPQGWTVSAVKVFAA